MDAFFIILLVVVGVAVAGLGWYVATQHTKGPEEPPSSRPVAARPNGIGARLSKTSRSLGGALRNVFGRSALDREFWEGLEEALIAADVGVEAATEVVDRVRQNQPEDVVAARAALHQGLVDEFGDRERRLRLGETKPAVVLVVGVNGSGKTTSIAKVARRLQTEGKVALLGAADTFRAAADTQLRAWGERLGVDVVGGQEGADPAAVAFDAYAAGRARGRDVVIIDTAGRLQSKANLMSELSKIRRVLEREAGRLDEVLLVLDATAGQNGISQVEEFARAVGVTGVVLTKLDGTARGGVVVAVEKRIGVPVKYVGVGEDIDDLVDFNPAEFVQALLSDA